MQSLTEIEAFVLAVETGSFSAAARKLGKAQSAISMAISNLEIDSGIELFDRSGRNPVLTEQGQALLPYAKGILRGNQEFIAKATSMAEGVETSLRFAIEQGIVIEPLREFLQHFAETFPNVCLEILTPRANDIASVLSTGQADIGLMIEQEAYPNGFQFRGVGHSILVPVCAPAHPLTQISSIRHVNLRQHRQLISYSQSTKPPHMNNMGKSSNVWIVENAALVRDLVCANLGWAELPYGHVHEYLQDGTLVKLDYAFQQSDILEGIDVVWTEQHALGPAAQWVKDQLIALPQNIWQNV